MAESRKSGGPLAILAPLAVIAGLGIFVFKRLKVKEDKDEKKEIVEEKSEEPRPAAGPSSATVAIPSRLIADSDLPGSPAGDFHDATGDLDAESPRVAPGQTGASSVASEATSVVSEAPSVVSDAATVVSEPAKANGQAVEASDDEPEFAEAEGEPAEEGSDSEEDSAAKAKLEEMMQRAQGTGEKLDKLVEENIPKT